MSVILINPDVVVFTDPVARNPHTFRWWAERGMIHWEDQTNGEYGNQTVKKTLEHLKGLSDMVGNSRTGKGFHMPDECKKYQDYVDQMIELCKRAAGQGMPDNVKHSKQLGDKAKADRQSRMVVVPGFNSSF